jgi:signal transduction histidine kinase
VTGAAARAKPYAVLVVDDDPLFLDVMGHLVNEGFPGARVTALGDAEGVLAACGREALDCVILDHDMPGMTGFQCAQQVREAHPYLPIILSTGAGDEMLAASALTNGVTDYIPKSHLSVRSLRRVVEHAVESTSQKRLIAEQHEDLETFAFALAHDIKQPLRQMSTFADLLAEDTEAFRTPKASRFLGFIRSASARLTDLVDTMLDYALLNHALVLEAVDIDAVAKEVCLSLSSYVEERRGRIEVHATGEVAGNRAVLAQILQNLVINGLKYNQSPTPSVSIRTAVDDSYCEIVVQDNGIGIEEVYLSEIFKPLRRLHHNDEFIGTGLGLAVVRKAIIALNGSILCRSEPGKGTEFVVRLPLANAGPLRSRRAARAPNHLRRKGSRARGSGAKGGPCGGHRGLIGLRLLRHGEPQRLQPGRPAPGPSFAAERPMHLMDPGEIHEHADVGRGDAGAGHDRDPIARLFDEGAKPVQALQRRGRAARGQHPFEAEADRGLERGRKVWDQIEGAVQRQAEARGVLDQAAQHRLVQRSVGAAGAQYHAREARGDVGAHQVHLGRGEVEVAGAGADHRIARGGDRCGQAHEARRGGQAVHRQRAAEFDAVRSALDGGLQAGRTVHADFEQTGRHVD